MFENIHFMIVGHNSLGRSNVNVLWLGIKLHALRTGEDNLNKIDFTANITSSFFPFFVSFAFFFFAVQSTLY